MTQQQFEIRQQGNIGQEILDRDGNVIAWTTDFWIGTVIAELLNRDSHLLNLDEKKGKDFTH